MVYIIVYKPYTLVNGLCMIRHEPTAYVDRRNLKLGSDSYDQAQPVNEDLQLAGQHCETCLDSSEWAELLATGHTACPSRCTGASNCARI